MHLYKNIVPTTLWLVLFFITSIADAYAQFSVCVVRADSIPVLNNNIKICQGASITLVARPCNITGNNETYLYQWTNINDPYITISNSKFLVQDAGAYEIQIKGRTSGYQAIDTVYVSYETKQNFSISPNTLVKCINDRLTIKAKTSGFKNYQWRLLGSNTVLNTSDSLVNPIAGREYVVTALTNNGCRVDTNLFVVKAPDVFEPKVNLGPQDTSLCGGLSLKLKNLNGNRFSHFWSNGSTDTVLLAKLPGKYWLRVKTEVCSASDTITLKNAPTPTILKNTRNFAACFGSGVELKINVLGDTNNYTYNWSPNSGLDNFNKKNPIAKPAISTKYLLKVLANGGCFDTINVNVAVNPKIEIKVFEKDTLLCGGDSIQLFADVKGGNPRNTLPRYSYNWQPTDLIKNPNLPNPWVSPKQTTLFKLKVNDASNCQDSAFVMAKVYNLKVTIDTLDKKNQCLNDTVQLRANVVSDDPNYLFKWSSTNVKLIDSTTNKISFIANKIGTYVFTANAQDRSGCNVKASTTIKVNPLPNINITETYRRICFGDSVKILATASGGTGIDYRFQWSPVNSAIFSFNQARATFVGKQEVVGLRKYKASVSDSYNCSSIADSIEIETIPFFVANLGSKDTTACQGNLVKLFPINPIPQSFTYRWVNTSTGTTMGKDTFLIVSETGLYELQVEDAQSGCSNKVSKQVIFLNTPSQPNIILLPQICNTDTLMLNVSNTNINNQKLWTSSGLGILNQSTKDTAYYIPNKSESGKVSFSLTLKNICGQSKSDTNSLVIASPLLMIEPKNLEVQKDSIFELKDLSGINETLSWDLSDGTIVKQGASISHSYSKEGLYKIKVKSSTINNKCVALDSVIVNVTLGQMITELFVPNVFSPKSSLIENQTFRIFGQNISSSNFSFIIYSRWGEIIYQTQSWDTATNQGWKGTGKDEQLLESGNYTYLLKGEFVNGEKFEKSGNVTLLR